MIQFDRKAFFDAARANPFGGRFTQAQVDALEMAINAGLGLLAREPLHVTKARADIGLEEIPGPRHAARILQMLKLCGYPFTDDETAWCGTAMAAWMIEAGIVPPAQGYRAANWRDWGVECAPQLGAIGVKTRKGGNHVFQIVGITADGKRYKALGGNQSNMVSITDVLVDETDSVRWPPNLLQTNIALPVMAAGTIRGSEA
ncbi:MAG: TIGR02594 family protein [Rhizorhabdus sp.]|uniref:TIGR02594 family protein n=1 Tax=Rhizorhabdus sp. TaxID=1968843 RepID=UPI001B4E8091|nr:TIGR02594 family protein [Rhizorhabdus sp.]MBP8235897.1 TIGR02594 family protein [Rhizorhabdus sp.]